MNTTMEKFNNSIHEQEIKTDYRNGSFLPADYKSTSAIKPQWLEEGMRRNQDEKMEELESEMQLLKSKLGL